MSGIVLSASVRQNLLSLQNTAQLLATTQNDLSTGNKVNTPIANQVLQAPTGYTTKSNVTSSAIAGATANNLLGPNVNATATGTVVNNQLPTPAPVTSPTLFVGPSPSDSLGTQIA